MKKIVVFLIMAAITAAISSPAVAQTKQQFKQMANLKREISQLNLEIQKLQNSLQPDYSDNIKALNAEIIALEVVKDSLNGSTASDALDRFAEIERQIDLKKKWQEFYAAKAIKFSENIWINAEIKKNQTKVALLETERDRIFLAVNTGNEIPKEMSNYTRRRCQNSNVVRREELVISKVENNIGAVNPQSSRSGYLVILENQNSNIASFEICPLNGGETTSHVLASDKTLDIYLVPGRYLVTVVLGGYKRYAPEVLEITGQVKTVLGRECFGYSLIPSWPKN
jgi:hypothetical protein